MTKKYKVYWADIAERDLINIIDYIAEQNIFHAENIFKKIKEDSSSLTQFPERGRIVPEFKDFSILFYRELIIPPWRVIYRIAENKVYILSVLDSRQNVEDILLSRLTSHDI